RLGCLRTTPRLEQTMASLCQLRFYRKILTRSGLRNLVWRRLRELFQVRFGILKEALLVHFGFGEKCIELLTQWPVVVLADALPGEFAVILTRLEVFPVADARVLAADFVLAAALEFPEQGVEFLTQ